MKTMQVRLRACCSDGKQSSTAPQRLSAAPTGGKAKQHLPGRSRFEEVINAQMAIHNFSPYFSCKIDNMQMQKTAVPSPRKSRGHRGQETFQDFFSRDLNS